MTIPSYSPSFDGLLNHGGTSTPSGPWATHLLAPDGSGNWVSVDPDGTVSYVPAGTDTPYTQFQVAGNVASVMPARNGGPLPGARWWNFAAIQVPTSGL